MTTRLLAVVLGVLAVTQPTQRLLDLTGKPTAITDEPFTKISGVREVPGGRVIVTDAMERSVSLVDLGRHSRATIGRQGEGPGEYHYPSAPFAASGVATWIY